MAGRLQTWIVERVAANLKQPQNTVFGRYTMMLFLNKNGYLEQNAVRLCNIKPDYDVLELGFGPGFGLQAAYEKVKDGKGKIYGIDTSMYMVDLAAKRMRKAVQKKRVSLFHGSAVNIPLNTDTVHRVFHTNCYYFWPNLRLVMREIYRVMKPGGIMVTALSLERLKDAQKAGFMQYGNIDPVRYMSCLEMYGFDNVRLEYMTDEKTGKPFEIIFAELHEKPAHPAEVLSDDSDEEIASEEAKLKEGK